MLFTQSINNNKIFLALYKKGRRVHSKWFVIYFFKNKLPFNRLGITAGKKTGNAVKRNRVKRIIKQAYIQNEIDMPVGIDLVIVAKASAVQEKSTALSAYLKEKGIGEIVKLL